MIEFYQKAFTTPYCQVTMIQGLAIAVLITTIFIIGSIVWYKFFDK